MQRKACLYNNYTIIGTISIEYHPTFKQKNKTKTALNKQDSLTASKGPIKSRAVTATTVNQLTNDTTHDTLMKVLYNIILQHADENQPLCDAKGSEKDGTGFGYMKYMKQ